MQNIINIFNLPFLYVCLIGGTVYCLWYLDKKRVSSPNYRRDVENARQCAAELARAKAALKPRSAKFPEPHDPAGVLRFALGKINHAEQCAEVAIGDGADDMCCGCCRGEEAEMLGCGEEAAEILGCRSCRGEAAVCIAEALYVLSFQEANVMLAHAKRILPVKTYGLVCDKYAELRKNYRR
ncbi:uncharacterized protein LOC100574041 [Acyrthosiphon pisum]|uniref:Uncharacterized protein n=1 Tax=Acyrthosiphon pisum TaxID=7029 RepID=A0A8R2A7Q6_ACYPI|nr:uncharacterized protein LOC100574041 [Acyrthosiphon pisum]|eukprot:XP_003244431.1 PREDICTED: uncharacterized protein LOC100574041 [Acyrthosiphon pisum]